MRAGETARTHQSTVALERQDCRSSYGGNTRVVREAHPLGDDDDMFVQEVQAQRHRLLHQSRQKSVKVAQHECFQPGLNLSPVFVLYHSIFVTLAYSGPCLFLIVQVLSLTYPSSQVVGALNDPLVGKEHFPSLWNGVHADKRELLSTYTTLLMQGPSGMYFNYHKHLKKVRQNAKCAIPAWEIALKNLYQKETQRPWTLSGDQPRLNICKALSV